MLVKEELQPPAQMSTYLFSQYWYRAKSNRRTYDPRSELLRKLVDSNIRHVGTKLSDVVGGVNHITNAICTKSELENNAESHSDMALSPRVGAAFETPHLILKQTSSRQSVSVTRGPTKDILAPSSVRYIVRMRRRLPSWTPTLYQECGCVKLPKMDIA